MFTLEWRKIVRITERSLTQFVFTVTWYGEVFILTTLEKYKIITYNIFRWLKYISESQESIYRIQLTFMDEKKNHSLKKTKICMKRKNWKNTKIYMKRKTLKKYKNLYERKAFEQCKNLYEKKNQYRLRKKLINII